MMPQHPVRDLMDRTIANLDFVKMHHSSEGPYEVTQLLNSCLAALSHPWERLKKGLKDWSWEDARQVGWEQLPKARETDRPTQSFYDELRQLRNGIAHGNLLLYPGHLNQIRGVAIWNNDRNGNRTWGTVLTVVELERVLRCFVKLAHGELEESEVVSHTA